MNGKIEGYRLVEFCNHLQTDTRSLEVLDVGGYVEVKPQCYRNIFSLLLSFCDRRKILIFDKMLQSRCLNMCPQH